MTLSSRGVRATILVAALTTSLALPSGSVGAATKSTYTTTRATNPARTLVYQGNTLVATFTDGARTVTLRGSTRTWSEPATTTATVTSTTWVRLLSSPFNGTVNMTWLTARLADTTPDLLALAFQYGVGAPVITSGDLQVAGDADYGPLQADGTRAEGSDFNDYLGVSWTYPNGTVDAPEASQLHSLDCSGYVRMVLGYRMGLPMSLSIDGGASLPRRAVQMDAAAPGVVLYANLGATPASRTKLLPGDLVFFDASTNDGTAIDHVGIYLGKDNGGHDRFVSSRKTANGPTMGDLGGKSLLDGTGLYATSFRSARRI